MHAHTHSDCLIYIQVCIPEIIIYKLNSTESLGSISTCKNAKEIHLILTQE